MKLLQADFIALASPSREASGWFFLFPKTASETKVKLSET